MNPYTAPLSELKQALQKPAEPELTAEIRDEINQASRALQEFQANNPQFVTTRRNLETLVSYYEEEHPNWDRVPTSQDFLRYAALADRAGKLSTTPEDMRAESPEAMPLSELRSVINNNGPVEQVYTMPIDELRESLGGSRGWTINEQQPTGGTDGNTSPQDNIG